MKKLVFAAIGLVAMVAGFGAFTASPAHASPTAVYVINNHVGAALAASATITSPATFDAAIITKTGRDAIKASAPFATIETASGDQVAQTAAAAAAGGSTWILVLTDGSTTAVKLDGKGITCVPVCDGVATATPDPADNFTLYKVTDTGATPKAVSATFTADAVQGTTTVSSKTITVVGQATDLAVSVVNNQTTLQAGATACAETQATGPTTAKALVTYTDINLNKLTGYNPVLSSSGSATLAIGSPGTFPQASSPAAATVGTLLTMVQSDANVAAEDAICGNAASSTAATLTASSGATEILGQTSAITRTASITVGGVPSAVALTASPAAIACDGTATSTVTAKVTDSAGNNVVDGTPVTFSVVALGTANPINTTTKAGSASSTITPLSASQAGVTVSVTAGTGTSIGSASILVSCNLAAPTVPAAAPTAGAPAGTIAGPNTGTGGYLGQDGSAGFPMWAILALAAGSLVLLGGGLVARRTGK